MHLGIARLPVRYRTYVCICLMGVGLIADLSLAQLTGDAAEMDRLWIKAEEAMGNDDPDGAAMNMGRAALMAKRLGLLHKEEPDALRLYQGAEALFRSQEHGYRAIALFRRAGGQLPASSGVCGSLALAESSLHRAQADLSSEAPPPTFLADHAKQWREAADSWSTVVASIIGEYQCP